MPHQVLRLGTRASRLALAQSGQVARALEALHDGLSVQLVPMTTRGDRLPGELAQLGGKGLFTEELEAGLLAGDLDLAVHSLKDLPVKLPQGLAIVAYPERVDPRDVLVSEVAEDLASLPAGATLLTGSLRRRAQLLAARPDLEVRGIRGNVDTRLEKWRRGGEAGVILAAAGLERLGLEGLPARPLPPEEIVPAPGQGILALETRAEGQAAELCRALGHPPTTAAARAERRIVEAFGGDCTLPLAAWARPAGDQLHLTAVLAAPDGTRLVRGEGLGETPATAAEACLEEMRGGGADDLLAELR